ncbi:MAG TPA: Uma2 family endonuclease [Isosphaeraceae bacterium]|jgi:Uma2 family endonuclease|nr:Uma2 family endonuclease [Isosphaeraceae bacterium]
MATATLTPAIPTPEGDVFVLDGVPWDLYVRLRDLPENRRVRMSYRHGTLELTLPRFKHEKPARRLSRLIGAVVEHFGLPCVEAGSTTFRRPGRHPLEGNGNEPDGSFYIQNAASVEYHEEIDLSVDPPPDIVLEVDNTNRSASKLPLYADLGVPEVWRYDATARTLVFDRLQADGTYAPADRGVALPMLTPSLVLDRLLLCDSAGMTETDRRRGLADWVRNVVAVGWLPGP